MNDRFFMELALAQAKEALAAGEFPVGCVVVADNAVRATGARLGTASGGRNETDHAEISALRHFQSLCPSLSPEKATLYCTLEPCLMCFGAILICGIGRVVWAYEDVMGGATGCDRKGLAPLYRERSMEIVSGLLREQSLALFKSFFQNPENQYWKDSLLATYTLGQ